MTAGAARKSAAMSGNWWMAELPEACAELAYLGARTIGSGPGRS